MANNQNSLKDRMLAVIADVNAQVAEREELVEMIAIALLTGKTCSSWALPARPRAMPSTPSVAESPAPGSLSGCSLNKLMRNSFLDALICPA